MTDRSKEQPFDERTALDALEQFQSEIKRYRQEREAVANEFETFVRTLPPADEVFPTEKPGTPSLAHPRPAAADRPAQPSVKPPPTRPAAATSPAPGADSAPKRKPSIPEVETRTRKATDAEPAAVATPPRTRSKAPLLAALLLIALVIGGSAYWNARYGTSNEPDPSAPTTEAPPPAATPETPAAVPAPPADAPAAAPTGSEITTLRPVWVRVIADGERVVERELPAGAKIPFTAEKTVMIRTGDAGAVRVVIRGEDQGTLGRDGAVVTRTFTIPEGTSR